MHTPDYEHLASLFDQSARIQAQIAQELRRGGGADDAGGKKPIQPPDLGSLQQAIFDVLVGAGDDGRSPREITKQLKRDDEPNIRQALSRMRDKGAVELLDGPGAQRWIVPDIYRP